MKDSDVVDAFYFGPSDKNTLRNNPTKMRNRKSKLKPYEQIILQHRAAGKSFRFICYRLQINEGIVCAPSTVMRYFNKMKSL